MQNVIYLSLQDRGKIGARMRQRARVNTRGERVSLKERKREGGRIGALVKNERCLIRKSEIFLYANQD